MAAARRGVRAIGIEYFEAALELANTTIAAHGLGAVEAEVLLADARLLPLADRCADVVTLLDVVQHLAPAELTLALGGPCVSSGPVAACTCTHFPTARSTT